MKIIATIGQISGVTGNFYKIGKFRNLHQFFLLHPYIKSMLQNIFLKKRKKKLSVRSVQLALLSFICSYFQSILKTLPFHFFGYKKLHPKLCPKDLENVLYEIYALIQEKTCVKLFTNIKNCDIRVIPCEKSEKKMTEFFEFLT